MKHLSLVELWNDSARFASPIYIFLTCLKKSECMFESVLFILTQVIVFGFLCLSRLSDPALLEKE